MRATLIALWFGSALGCTATDLGSPDATAPSAEDVGMVDADSTAGADPDMAMGDAGPFTPDASPAGPDASPAGTDASPAEPDVAMAEPDAAPAGLDVAMAEPDAAPAELDAAPADVDAAPAELDAAPAELDAAPIEVDAAPAEVDAAPAEVDAAAPACDDGRADPPEGCDAADPGTQENVLSPMDGCHFGLRLQDDRAFAHALMDRIAPRAGGYVTLAQVLDDLNRRGQPGITAGAADRLRNHGWVGFRWNEGDQGVDDWMPQGITGHSDAAARPREDDKRLILVSWYHRTEARPTKGARVSLADVTDMDAVRYRHLLLVEPVERDGVATFESAEYDSGDALHAGGIVWWGDLLYVADTAQGFRVFDLSRVVRIEDTDDTDRVGVTADRVDAHGYRYIVPQVARYRRAEGACRINFSYVALDRSSDPPTLLSGEYDRDTIDGRMTHWRLDPQTGWLEVRGGESRGFRAHVSGQTRVQGGLSWAGDYYLSSSSQVGRLGRLYRNRPGEASRITAWPYGCEDLYYERATDLVWTATEHPGSREVVGIPLVRP